jgi:hypothetical protein
MAPATRYMYVLMMAVLSVLDVSHVYVHCATIAEVTDLTTTLLTGYRKEVRPASDHTVPTVVNITLNLVTIQSLEEVTGKFSIVAIFDMAWWDDRLKWDPTKYGNVINIYMEGANIWVPPLINTTPYDKASAPITDSDIHIRVYSNGLSLWSIGSFVISTCSINVKYYPFDIQTCLIRLAPWGYGRAEIFLNSLLPEFTLPYYNPSGEWSISKTKAENGGDTNPFSSVEFSIELERRSTFMVINVILPIIFMACLNCLVFVLPAESGERVGYALTVLLSIAVFLTLIGDNIPKTSQPMSIFSYYLLNILVLSAVIVVATVFNLRLYYRDEINHVPKWLGNIAMCSFCRRAKVDVHKSNHQAKPIEYTKPDINEQNDKSGFTSDGEFGKHGAVESSQSEKRVATWHTVSSLVDVILLVITALWLFISTAVFMTSIANRTG